MLKWNIWIKKPVSFNNPSIFVAAVNWNIKTRLFNNNLNMLVTPRLISTRVVLWRRQVMLYNNNDYFSQSNDAIQPELNKQINFNMNINITIECLFLDTFV